MYRPWEPWNRSDNWKLHENGLILIWMSTIKIQEISRDPVDFLRRMEAGEPMVVLKDERPLAEIRPIARNNPGPRPFGLSKGQFMVPDDFDAPLPDEVLNEFEGK